MARITKAVIPVAGLGTRFLPVTKVVPKELLPIVDKPVIHYIVEEVLQTGINEIILVNHPSKTLIEEYFRNDTPYGKLLAEKDKKDLLKELTELNKKIKIKTVYQKEQLGLGHAVLQAKEAVGDDWFMLILPDVLIDAKPNCCEQLVAVWRETGKAVIAVERVSRENLSSCGVIAVDRSFSDKLHKISYLVEKPRQADAPSELSIAGRYLLSPSIFEFIEHTRPGAMGEIQITDAICELAKNEEVLALEFTGKLHDAGDKQGYLSANTYYANKLSKEGDKILNAKPKQKNVG